MKKQKRKSFFQVNYLICGGKFWTVFLNKDQSYLGRSIVSLKRDIENPLQLTEEEWKECWFEIMPRLAAALKKSFNADRLNYSHLANSFHHVHWHVVPRYEKNPVRKFAGETFKDERVGKNYSPYPEKILPPEIMEKICEKMKEGFRV